MGGKPSKGGGFQSRSKNNKYNFSFNQSGNGYYNGHNSSYVSRNPAVLSKSWTQLQTSQRQTMNYYGDGNVAATSGSTHFYTSQGHQKKQNKPFFSLGTGRKKKTRPPLPMNGQVRRYSTEIANVSTQNVKSNDTTLITSIAPVLNLELPVVITTDLANRLAARPDVTYVPFCIARSLRVDLGTQQQLHFVPLPFSLPYTPQSHHNNDIWPEIKRQLQAIEGFCRQGYSAIDIIYSTISKYCQNSQEMMNFEMLKHPDIAPLLVKTLPMIAEHALELPHLVQEPIPVLVAGESKTIFLTRRLCCSLLANAFFCTFPTHKLRKMPDFNFFRLYNDTGSERCQVKKEKLKCILNYFTQMHASKQNSAFQNQVISFERRCIAKKCKWAKEGKTLCDIKIEPVAKIEQAVNMLQVDFANRMVGGGVLNDGSVMEEIRFSASPELIVSRLFTQRLTDDEVLAVTGTEIFSVHTGYSTRFKYVAPAAIKWGLQPVDNFGRTHTQLVTMDASYFKKNDPWKQFQQQYIDRDLHKCKVAFTHGRATVSPVATGNWGCGAFNGNPELKFFIQWMAASRQNRPYMQYHTNGNVPQGQELIDMSAYIRGKNITIGQLYQVVTEFIEDTNAHQAGIADVFTYVKYRFSG